MSGTAGPAPGLSPIHVLISAWLAVLLAVAVLGPSGGAAADRNRSRDVRFVGYAVGHHHHRQHRRRNHHQDRAPKVLPSGGTRVFAHNRFLVAYYGVAGSGALGVLGQAPPARIWPRLVRAARAFKGRHRPVQPVFELIVDVARSAPGRDGNFSQEVARADVWRYIRAAHRLGALLVIDIQPGRSDFLTTAKRWTWALRDPWVGLAIDPEWRVGPRQVPGTVIGHVQPAEVNRVSSWLDRLTARHRLPQKLFVIHQFRTTMLPAPERIRSRRHLATVQHVDGFGTQRQKLGTYHTLARPRRFVEGFKLFYRADTNLMTPRRVLQIRPRVRFVSYQ